MAQKPQNNPKKEKQVSGKKAPAKKAPTSKPGADIRPKLS